MRTGRRSRGSPRYRAQPLLARSVTSIDLDGDVGEEHREQTLPLQPGTSPDSASQPANARYPVTVTAYTMRPAQPAARSDSTSHPVPGEQFGPR